MKTKYFFSETSISVSYFKNSFLFLFFVFVIETSLFAQNVPYTIVNGTDNIVSAVKAEFSKIPGVSIECSAQFEHVIDCRSAGIYHNIRGALMINNITITMPDGEQVSYNNSQGKLITNDQIMGELNRATLNWVGLDLNILVKNNFVPDVEFSNQQWRVFVNKSLYGGAVNDETGRIPAENLSEFGILASDGKKYWSSNKSGDIEILKNNILQASPFFKLQVNGLSGHQFNLITNEVKSSQEDYMKAKNKSSSNDKSKNSTGNDEKNSEDNSTKPNSPTQEKVETSASNNQASQRQNDAAERRRQEELDKNMEDLARSTEQFLGILGELIPEPTFKAIYLGYSSSQFSQRFFGQFGLGFKLPEVKENRTQGIGLNIYLGYDKYLQTWPIYQRDPNLSSVDLIAPEMIDPDFSIGLGTTFLTDLPIKRSALGFSLNWTYTPLSFSDEVEIGYVPEEKRVTNRISVITARMDYNFFFSKYFGLSFGVGVDRNTAIYFDAYGPQKRGSYNLAFHIALLGI